MTRARTAPRTVRLPAVVALLLLGAASSPSATAVPDAGGGTPTTTGWSAPAAPPAPGGSTPPAPPAPAAPPAPQDVGTAARWSWPLAGRPAVVRPFTAPAQRWSPGHRGVDLASVPGAPVRSPADGRVVLSRRVVDRAVVVVEHAAGLRTTLEPVADAPAVGTPVARGAVVGRLSAQGAHCPGCLHWGVRRGEGRSAPYLDPLSLLAPPSPPVLLPLPPRLRAG
ncbi:peptidoglycan DD-metalloendopeptidase family protein [Pseudokineococcus basanitobsidens]|uniref:Peptidoglycan DD-metalloendopeptidase family protein n=1 Tax=Pseudokineococcus basanitobsidens TaxID=1926649 RepID=A0ABU8RJW0_9ACTN